jgi:hypothetical protein
MLKRFQNILTNVSILPGLFMLCNLSAYGQTISNTGATISIINNTAVSSASINNSSGTISNNGTLNLSANYSNSGSVNGNGLYNVGGNWTNSGTFIPGVSSVNFNGSSAQTIAGSNPTPFYNIIVNGAGIVLSQNGSFSNVFTLTNGNISGIDTMTLISNSGNTGRIAPVGASASITATFKMQRYVNRSTIGYCFWSSPAQVENLDDLNHSRSPNFFITDIGGIDGNNTSKNVSVYNYLEPTEVYSPITTKSFSFTNGRGIMIYMRNSITTMAPSVFRSNGVPTFGNVNVGVTYTAGTYAGHTELGNPYASPIDWGTFYTDNSSLLQSTFYIMEANGTQYPFTSGSIPMNQGFAVNATAAGTLTFKESHKTNVDAAYLKPSGSGDPADEPNTVKFTLSNDANEYACPTIISFDGSYSKNYNPKEDAEYFTSPIVEVPVMYTVSDDNKNLILNKLPDVDKSLDIPLKSFQPIPANYDISMTGLDNFTSYNCVLLIDNSTGNILNNFIENSSYKFNTAYGPQEKNLTLRFSKIGIGESCATVSTAANDNVQIYPLQQNAIINFNLAQSEDVVISVYNVLGQKVSADINRTVQNDKVSVRLPMVSGLYIVKVQSAYGTTTQKISISE